MTKTSISKYPKNTQFRFIEGTPSLDPGGPIAGCRVVSPHVPPCGGDRQYHCTGGVVLGNSWKCRTTGCGGAGLLSSLTLTLPLEMGAQGSFCSVCQHGHVGTTLYWGLRRAHSLPTGHCIVQGTSVCSVTNSVTIHPPCDSHLPAPPCDSHFAAMAADRLLFLRPLGPGLLFDGFPGGGLTVNLHVNPVNVNRGCKGHCHLTGAR